ncbi:MAG: hypothetical protein WD009_03685, partial [Phycisphaeraceae bacterium]
MLGPDDRLYFIHIPKTAGTSLVPLIDAQFSADAICPAQLWRELVRLPLGELPRYRLFRGHFGAHGLDPFLPRPPVCITMLREPMRLAYSTYQFVLREPGTRIHKLAVSQAMDFEAFVAHRRTRARISDKMARNLSFDLKYDPDTETLLSLKSQAAVDRWVSDHSVRPAGAERLERAKAQLARCACFGLVERFDASMALLAYTLDWPPVQQVQKLRVADKRFDPDELTPACLEQLREANALDIELYAYAEQCFDEAVTRMIEALRPWAEPTRPLPDRFEDDPDAVHAALDRRYRQRRIERDPTPRRVTHVDFNDALPGSGWHGRETSPTSGRCFRWTGPGRSATLDLHVGRDVPLRLTLRVIDAIDEAALAGLRVAVDDAALTMRTLDGAGSRARTLQGEIPPRPPRPGDAAPALTRLTLSVSATASLAARSRFSADGRAVGVAVEWVDVRPASELAPGERPAEATTLVPRRQRLAAAGGDRYALGLALTGLTSAA